MKNISKLTLVSAALIAGLSLLSPPAVLPGPLHPQASAAGKRPDSDMATLQHLADAFAKAYNSGDLDRVIDFYSADVIYMMPDMPNHVGRNVMEESYKELFADNLSHVSVKIQEAKIFGDMGFDRATYTTTYTPKSGGKTIVAKGQLLEIVRNENGKWRSFRVMNIPQK